MKLTNILIVGVGGQGVVLASEILATVALNKGYDVKQSEVHGMAQRGGVVSSHIRFGHKIYSPLIPEGAADFILSFEEAETLRWIKYLSQRGKIVLNTQKIVPPMLNTSGILYPSNTLGILYSRGIETYPVDCLSIVRKIGNEKMINTFLLGVLSSHLEFSKDEWLEVLKEKIPAKFRDSNINAFIEGENYKFFKERSQL